MQLETFLEGGAQLCRAAVLFLGKESQGFIRSETFDIKSFWRCGENGSTESPSTFSKSFESSFLIYSVFFADHSRETSSPSPFVNDTVPAIFFPVIVPFERYFWSLLALVVRKEILFPEILASSSSIAQASATNSPLSFSFFRNSSSVASIVSPLGVLRLQSQTPDGFTFSTTRLACHSSSASNSTTRRPPSILSPLSVPLYSTVILLPSKVGITLNETLSPSTVTVHTLAES